MSRFLGLTVDSRYPFPEPVARPLADQQGNPLDPLQPVVTQTNPRWYFKWLRMIPSRDYCWNRTFYLPPGTRCPITLDRAEVNGWTETAAWTLYIARPENASLVLNTYDLVDPNQYQLTSNSSLQRSHTTPNLYCQIDNYPEQSLDNVTLVESWPMSRGNMIYRSGNYWYDIENTGTEPAVLVTIASFLSADLQGLLESPIVSPNSTVTYAWRGQ
jgi:hypothetical protein